MLNTGKYYFEKQIFIGKLFLDTIPGGFGFPFHKAVQTESVCPTGCYHGFQSCHKNDVK